MLLNSALPPNMEMTEQDDAIREFKVDKLKEAMNSPSQPPELKERAWQVDSDLDNEILLSFGWWRSEKILVNDNGAITGRNYEWEPYGDKQMVSKEGANKIYMSLKLFLSQDLPLTAWDESMVFKVVRNHCNEISISLSCDPLMGAKDENLEIIHDTLKTVFLMQAFKAKGGEFMKALAEDRKRIVTEQQEKGKEKSWRSNIPFIGGGSGDQN